MRCSITGMTTSDSHWLLLDDAAGTSSGSKRRRSTTVEPSSIESAKWAKPHVWNSGAAMWVRHPNCSGIRDSSDTAAGIPASLRGAPLGVPVVPDVRITIRRVPRGGYDVRVVVGAMRDSRVVDSTVVGPVAPPDHALGDLGVGRAAR